MNWKYKIFAIIIFLWIGIDSIYAQQQYHDDLKYYVIDSVRSSYPFMDFDGDNIPDKIRIQSIHKKEHTLQHIYFIQAINDSVMLPEKLIKTIYPRENIGAVLLDFDDDGDIDLIEVKKYKNNVAQEFVYENVNMVLMDPRLIGTYQPNGDYIRVKE